LAKRNKTTMPESSKRVVFERRFVMLYGKRHAKINLKVLIIFVLIMVAIVTSLFAARQVRRGILSKMSLEDGEAAFEKQNWQAAYKNFGRYLSRNPDDIEILKKYAQAAMSIRPLNVGAVNGAVSAYRRVMQLDPLDNTVYEKLAKLYAAIGNFEELAYITRAQIENDPNDRQALLWLAEALFRLGKTDAARQELLKLDSMPDKSNAEYVQACALMHKVILADTTIGTVEARSQALEWLNKAVENVPESAQALANRARFCRETSEISGLSEQEVQDYLKHARDDLAKADALGAEDPRLLLFIGAEWMSLGELQKAELKLKAAEDLTKEKLEEYFFDINNGVAIKFLFASELAIRRKAAAEDTSSVEDAALADEVLAVLKEKSQRFRVLPSAIRLYLATGNVSKARSCLDEYLENMYTHNEGAAVSKLQLAYLQALVAKAEERPYLVIDVLQPATANDAAKPELWQLLAEAYSQTDQNRRAVSALMQYIRLRPRDLKMKVQLAKEYLQLRDYSKAFETAQLAESMDPTDIRIRLLRIETSIYSAVEQAYTVNKPRLQALSAELAELREEDPDRIDIRILQAIIADNLGQSEKAEGELKSAIEECGEPLRAEIQLVYHYSRAKQMDKALSVCQDACKRNPEVAEPWIALSSIYAADADYDSARNCLRRGLDAATGKWEKRSLSMRLALLEYWHGDRSTAIRLFSEIAAQDKEEIRARVLLLNTREVQQNQRVAENQPTAEDLVEQLKTAEGQSGLNWRLYQALMWLSSDDWRSRQQNIISNLQYCIDSDPEWSSPVKLLAQMYERLEDFAHVEDVCRQALMRNPSATDVADVLVNLYEKQRRYPDAEKVLQQIETNSRVVRNWASARNIGIYLNAGNYSRAIDELKLRVSNNDQDANSRILLARLVYWQNRRDANQALNYLKEAEAIAPDSMALTAARVSILKAEGQEEKARQILDDYVADSNSFSAYSMRAAYFAGEGELERAEQDYKKLTTFENQEIVGYELLSNFYARNERFDQAVAALEEGLAAFPENSRLKRRLMKTLFLRNQAQDRRGALEILAALQEKLPHDPELMKIEAMHILQTPNAENLQTARQKLQSVVGLEPTAVDAQLALIRIAMQQSQYEDARNLAIRALGSNPDNPALLSARAEAELLLKNTQMAAQLAQLALQKDPNDMQARDVLTAVALDSKDADLLEQSHTLIESVLGSDPNNEKLLLSRARVLVSMDNPKVAIPELEAYCRTEKGKGSINALVTLADLYRFSGEMDKSKQWLDRAEQLNCNSLTVIHARLMWLVAQKRFDEMEDISSVYLSAKEQSPKSLEAAATVLASLDSMKLKQEAVKLFRQAVNLHPTSLSARLGLASSLYQTGDTQQAKQAYQEVLDEYPDNIQALNDLAWLLQEHDQSYDAALELANRGLILSPDEMHLLDTRGTILENMKQLDDARKDFARLVQLTPPDSRQKANALFRLGRICARLNDLNQAKQLLNDALEIDGKINVFTPDERSEIMKILRESGIQAAGG
jgi:tetratricopeptide (TPR) repeat protein